MPKPALILDTPLLVLLIVGATDESMISRHKRLQRLALTVEDFHYLRERMEQVASVVATPHILTEASNLCSQIGEPDKTRVRKTLQLLISKLDEVVKSSSDLAGQQEFVQLGITDVALLDAATTRDSAVLMTLDFRLYGKATKAGLNVVNYHHIRPANQA